jgi:hypothetical protein
MKKFILGFISGAVLFGGITVLAIEYIANPIDFEILVNGKEFISDPPALEIDGRTYLPLRSMGEVLGIPVNWNEELRQVEVGTANLGNSETELQNSKIIPPDLDIMGEEKVSDDFDGNGEKENLYIQVKHELPSDDVNNPIAVNLKIGNSDAVVQHFVLYHIPCDRPAHYFKLERFVASQHTHFERCALVAYTKLAYFLQRLVRNVFAVYADNDVPDL